MLEMHCSNKQKWSYCTAHCDEYLRGGDREGKKEKHLNCFLISLLASASVQNVISFLGSQYMHCDP